MGNCCKVFPKRENGSGASNGQDDTFRSNGSFEASSMSISRKTGLIQSCVNLAIQILCLVLLAKVISEGSNRRGYYVHGHRINKANEKSMTHVLIDIMFFVGVDIIAYLWLIFGLLKRKPSILTGWLIFSIMEVIVVNICSFYFAVYLTITSHSGASVLGLILPTLVSLYLTYHVCTIYTARHEMIQERNSSIQFNSNTLLINPVALSYPQYRIPHSPYVPSRNHASSNCNLNTVSCSLPEAAPPPYKVSEA